MEKLAHGPKKTYRDTHALLFIRGKKEEMPHSLMCVYTIVGSHTHGFKIYINFFKNVLQGTGSHGSGG